MSPKYLVVLGTPGSGFRYYGPFDSSDLALEFAERWTESDWWVEQMVEPS